MPKSCKKMKQIYTIVLLFAFSSAFSQAPWENSEFKRKGAKPTLKEMASYAESYFNTIDRNKKGSGLKPFKRWEYNMSHYLNPDGTIAPVSELWGAWKQKQALSKQSKNDVSDWKPLGPYNSKSIFSSTKQFGQGRVNAIAVDPNNSNTYYVGAPAGGIWKSTDAGLNWTPLVDHLPQIGVSGIAIHPTNSNIIYIATGDDDARDSRSVGVWKTTDGGTTWNNTGSIPGNPDRMNEIYINPNNTETVLVATSSGVQKTTNGGGTWVTKQAGNVIDLKMKPGDPSTWYALTSNLFYKSTDGGESFSIITLPGLTGSGRLTMDVTIANPNYVYVVSSKTRNDDYAFNGVYKSTNSGSSFTKTTQVSDIFGSSQAWFDLALTVSSVNPEIVYVGVLDLWKSTNGGNTFSKINDWRNVNQSSYTHADIHFLRFIDGKFFAGTDGGIFVSTDEARNFVDLTKNLAISQFYRISVSQQKLDVIAGGLQDNGGFGFDSRQWRHYHGGDGMEGIVNPNDYNIFYGFTQYGGSLNITNNQGKSRVGSVRAPAAETGTNDSGGRWITPLTINKEGNLYSGYSQIYRLDNGIWSKVSNHNFGGDLGVLVIDPTDSNIMYAANNVSLFRSTDKGNTFTNVPFSNGEVVSIAISTKDNNTVWIATRGGVFKTTNMNSSSPNFTALSGNLPSETKTVIKYHERSGKNTVYLGTTLGVYFLNDDNSNWQTFDNKLPNVQIRDLEINEEESKLYAATFGRGIFSSDIPKVLPPNDVRLVSINNINNTVVCGTNISPAIVVQNKGQQAITNLTINYNIDGGANQVYNWTGNIATNAEATITIPVINSTKGVHTFNAETVLTNDAYASNNTLNTRFALNESNTSPTTVNTFENSEDQLLATTSSNSSMWTIISSNKTLLNIPNGSKAYSTTAGTYPINTTGYLHTKCYNLSQVLNPVFKFNMGFDIELNWDYLVVEYTTDQGVSWNILGSASDPNWYNSNSTANGLPGKQWTGLGESGSPSNASIKEYSYDLSSLANETSVTFRFKFVSDQAEVEEGAIIDNLVIEGTLSTNDEAFLKGIAIYPNPSDNIFNISRPDSDQLTIKVLDLTGKQVFYKKNITDTNYQIDLSNHAKGIYLLNMSSNGKIASKKLILK